MQDIKLDFIDTSNIADKNYVGITRVLRDWGPLLNYPSNPDATLLTLFMNWIHELPGVEGCEWSGHMCDMWGLRSFVLKDAVTASIIIEC
jgi:hypothetical protein